MKSILPFILFLLLLSCRNNSSSNTSNVYNRIVSLSPSITRMIIDMNESEHLIGITPFCPHVQNAELIGNSIIPSIEKIISLNPDLVIMSIEDETMIKNEQIESAGIKVLYLKESKSYSDIESNYRLIAEKLNYCPDNKLAEYRKIINSFPTRNYKKAVILLNSVPIVAVSSNSFMSDAAEIAGYHNMIKTKNPYPFISLEYLSKLNPDIILISDYGGASELSNILSRIGSRKISLHEYSSENSCYYTPQDFIASIRSFKEK
ncbi:MAG: ABC transporter substrate-binding protein [Spirochaetes bacterium]|nr:ABC transporter substrate-binding protein [Spirochaetota bacterium]